MRPYIRDKGYPELVHGLGWLIGVLMTAPALAQTISYEAPRSASVMRNNNPAPLESETERPLGLHGSVTVSVTRQSNVLRRGNGTGDTSVTVSPLLWYQNEIGRHGLIVRYRGDYFKFKDLSGENSIDHNLQGDFLLDLTDRLQGRIGAGYIKGHEIRGQLGTVDTASTEPNRFTENSLEGSLTYGRRENILQLTGTVGISRLKYTNNNGGEGRNKINSDFLGGTVYYNLGPKTSLLASLGRREIDYVDPVEAFDLDSTETTVSVGARWEATAITTGEVRIGRSKKDLKDPARADFSGTTYSGRINWAPREYSIFSFYASRETTESTEAESDYTVSDLLGVSWSHTINEAWSLNARYSKGKDAFSSGREDKLTDWGVGVNYGLFRWGALGVQYAQTSRDSSEAENNFDDEILFFTFSSSFGVSY